MHFTVTADTDIGIAKETNQDSVLFKHGTYSGGEVLMAVICDGMGGLAKQCKHHLVLNQKMK